MTKTGQMHLKQVYNIYVMQKYTLNKCNYWKNPKQLSDMKNTPYK